MVTSTEQIPPPTTTEMTTEIEAAPPPAPPPPPPSPSTVMKEMTAELLPPPPPTPIMTKAMATDIPLPSAKEITTEMPPAAITAAVTEEEAPSLAPVITTELPFYKYITESPSVTTEEIMTTEEVPSATTETAATAATTATATTTKQKGNDVDDEFRAARERNSKMAYAVGITAVCGAGVAFLAQIRRRGFKDVLLGVSLPRDMLFYGGIYTLGDLSQQKLRKSGDDEAGGVDFLHAARIGLVTTTFFGPGFHKLYRAMDRRWPGVDGKTVFRKVALDQLIGTGLGMFAFFGSLSVLERHDDYTHDIRVKYVPAWISGGIFWPTANFFNFRFVPSQYRVIYVSCAALVWTNFLCYLRDTYGEEEET